MANILLSFISVVAGAEGSFFFHVWDRLSSEPGRVYGAPVA